MGGDKVVLLYGSRFFRFACAILIIAAVISICFMVVSIVQWILMDESVLSKRTVGFGGATTKENRR